MNETKPEQQTPQQAETGHGEEQTSTHEKQEKSIGDYQWEQYEILKLRLWNVS